MKFSTRVRPVRYIKSHTSEITSDIAENREPAALITQNGEVKLVIMDVKSVEEQEETLSPACIDHGPH